jgi:hypothetical protein
MDTQLLVPPGFKGVSDETVIRIDFHIAPPCQLSVIARSFDVLTAQSFRFGGARLKFALDREANLNGHRRHQLDQKRADRRIDHLARR